MHTKHKGFKIGNWTFGECLEISEYHNPTDVYLRRWNLVKHENGVSLKLHQILRPDKDRALHDHPWAFVGIILKGGYVEQVPQNWERAVEMRAAEGRPFGLGTIVRRPGRWRAVPAGGIEGLHRIDRLLGEDAWSLVFTGPYQREWGFSERPGHWAHWKEYDPDS